MKNTVVQYKDLSRWDVKSFLNTLKAPFPVVKLWNYIYEHSEKENIFTEKEKEFSILWVTNKVWIYLNEIKKWKEINQPYKKVLSWEIAYNPYRVNVGSIWIVQEEYNNYYISPAYVVFWTNEKLYNKYLYLILSSSWYNDFLRAKTSGSVRQNLTFNLLSDLEIPLPNIITQKQIVEEYENNKKQAQNLRNEALEKEKNIDDFLVSELGIEKQKQNKKKWPFIVRFKDLERWWIEFNSHDWTLDNLLCSNKFSLEKIWNIAKLNEVIEFNKEDREKQISFIPMEYISDKSWTIEKSESRKFKSVYTWYTKFIEWDIIWAKITPCMQNWKSAIATNLENWIWVWSTEFHVIRPSNKVYDKYLWLILRSKYLLDNAKRYFIGSAWQQRVPDAFLKELKIPLPPIWDEKTPWTQKYIVSKIDEIKQEIDNLNAKAEKLEKEADENLEKAILWA